MKKLKTFNEKTISNKNEIKKYVYKYDNYYYYVDDVDGDVLVSDIEDARIFSEKQVTQFNIDDINRYLDIMYTDNGQEINITHPFEKIEL